MVIKKTTRDQVLALKFENFISLKNINIHNTTIH